MISEVKRFYSDISGRECVYASDFDAAQSELAALREELADTKANLIDYQQRLADAERRNAELQAIVNHHSGHIANCAGCEL